MIYIILFPMNNCKDGVGSLGRINWNKRDAALDTVLPEPWWPSPQGLQPFPPLMCIPCGETVLTEGTPKKKKGPQKKIGSTQAFESWFVALKPGLKFHCPEHGALDKVRRSGLRQTQGISDKSLWGQMREPSKIQPQINHCLHHVFRL